MGNRWVSALDRGLHEVAGLWAAGDYTFLLARLGLLHLGCNREVAALLRRLLTHVSLYFLEMMPSKCNPMYELPSNH